MDMKQEVSDMTMPPEEKMAKMKLAFRALRKMGFIAKYSKEDCQHCAIAAFPPRKADQIYYCIFNKQDVDDFKRTGRMMLSYGPLIDDLTPDQSTSHGIRAGELIIKALLDAGLGFEWNGEADKRVIVI